MIINCQYLIRFSSTDFNWLQTRACVFNFFHFCSGEKFFLFFMIRRQINWQKKSFNWWQFVYVLFIAMRAQKKSLCEVISVIYFFPNVTQLTLWKSCTAAVGVKKCHHKFLWNFHFLLLIEIYFKCEVWEKNSEHGSISISNMERERDSHLENLLLKLFTVLRTWTSKKKCEEKKTWKTWILILQCHTIKPPPHLLGKIHFT